MDCPHPGHRFQSQPETLSLSEVQTAVQGHPALGSQTGTPTRPPRPHLLPSSKWSRKTPSFCPLFIPSPTSPTPFPTPGQNSTNYTSQKGKGVSWLNLPALFLPETWDSFFGNSSGGGGPAREEGSPFHSLWPTPGSREQERVSEEAAVAPSPSPTRAKGGLGACQCILAIGMCPLTPPSPPHEFQRRFFFSKLLPLGLLETNGA